MVDIETLWQKAFAFDDIHGEAGPAVMSYQITRLRIDGRHDDANELAAMGSLLEVYHRAWANPTH